MGRRREMTVLSKSIAKSHELALSFESRGVYQKDKHYVMIRTACPKYKKKYVEYFYGLPSEKFNKYHKNFLLILALADNKRLAYVEGEQLRNLFSVATPSQETKDFKFRIIEKKDKLILLAGTKDVHVRLPIDSNLNNPPSWLV